MRILITGAYGYFGTALTQRLAKEHAVTCWGRPPRASVAEQVYDLAAKYAAEVLVCGDGEYGPDFRAMDAVVHLAGGGASGGALADAEQEVRDNVDSVRAVLRGVRPGARLLLASSIYVYGPTDDPAKECDALWPDTLYGQLKTVAESLWQQKGGAALRFSHIYGAGCGIDFGRDGVTERLARSAASGSEFAISGDGEQALQLLHIEDACEAVALALRLPAFPPALNLAGETFTINRLAWAFDAKTTKRRASLQPIRREMSTALARGLGWSPSVSLTGRGPQELIEMMRRSA